MKKLLLAATMLVSINLSGAKALEADCFVVGTSGNVACGSDSQGNMNSASVISSPSATLTRPANTTAYTQNNLISNNTVAGSITVPSFSIGSVQASIPRVRIRTLISTGWDQAVIRVRLWTTAPTYTNGDGGAYAPSSGGAIFIGQYDVTLTQFNTDAQGQGAVSVGPAAIMKLSGTTTVFWDMQLVSSTSVTPTSGQIFVLIPEIVN